MSTTALEHPAFRARFRWDGLADRTPHVMEARSGRLCGLPVAYEVIASRAAIGAVGRASVRVWVDHRMVYSKSLGGGLRDGVDTAKERIRTFVAGHPDAGSA